MCSKLFVNINAVYFYQTPGFVIVQNYTITMWSQVKSIPSFRNINYCLQPTGIPSCFLALMTRLKQARRI